jgi:hypothetical protein
MRAPRTAFPRSAALLVVAAATGALAAPDTAAPPAVRTNLSSTEALTQAKEYVSKMQDSLRRIVQLQEVAKKQKDVIKLNCVNDKLLQVKGHMAVTEQAMSGLNEAVAKSDEEGREHEYTRVTILYQKVLVLGTEAENCIGEDLSYVGETTVTVEIDPSIPQRDVTAFDLPAIDTTRVPVATSPM